MAAVLSSTVVNAGGGGGGGGGATPAHASSLVADASASANLARPSGLSAAALALASEAVAERKRMTHLAASNTPGAAAGGLGDANATMTPATANAVSSGVMPPSREGSLTPLAFTAKAPATVETANALGILRQDDDLSPVLAGGPSAGDLGTPADAAAARVSAQTKGIAAGPFGKGVLETLRAVWDSHATAMDACGRRAAGALDAAETSALGAMARIDGAPEGISEAVAAARALADGARDALLTSLEESRQLDDAFARETYALARGAFEYGTNAVHDALVSKYRDRADLESKEQQRRLDNCRRSGEVHLRDTLASELARQKHNLTSEFDVERAAHTARIKEMSSELQHANETGRALKAQKEVIKQELAAALGELRQSSMWKQRYENERKRTHEHKNNTGELKRAYEAKLQEWKERMDLETGRRDRELARLRTENSQMKDQLRSLHKDANIAHIRNNVSRVETPEERARRVLGGGGSVTPPGSQ